MSLLIHDLSHTTTQKKRETVR